MACVHNQAKINELNAQIEKKQQQISNLNRNIIQCRNISEQHHKFNEKVNCVINNLDDTTVIAGVPYDYGKMTECLNGSNQTIESCDAIIKESLNRIKLLRSEISSMRITVASLQGNCYACSIEEE